MLHLAVCHISRECMLFYIHASHARHCRPLCRVVLLRCSWEGQVICTHNTRTLTVQLMSSNGLVTIKMHEECSQDTTLSKGAANRVSTAVGGALADA